MTMEDRKFILPNVISDAQPIQCPIQLKTQIFIEAKFKAIREKNIFFQDIICFFNFFFLKKRQKTKTG